MAVSTAQKSSIQNPLTPKFSLISFILFSVSPRFLYSSQISISGNFLQVFEYCFASETAAK